MNKKGFIYVISASLLVVVLLIIFFSQQEFSYVDETKSELKRIGFANDFVEGFNQDLSRVLNIASFRSMIALEEYVAVRGEFLNDTESAFMEMVQTGTYNESSYEIMENSSLDEYLSRVNVIADRFGLSIDVSINDIHLGHYDAWHLDVSVNASVFVEDKSGLAYWNYTKLFSSVVPIENLRDPLYSVNTRNRISNTILEFSEDSFVVGDDLSNFLDFVQHSYYVESSDAPSFIQRFSNNMSSSDYGIESIVNVLTISDQDLETYPGRVKIDYIYFNDLDVVDIRCDFEGVPFNYYLVLYNDSLERYGLEDVDSSTEC